MRDSVTVICTFLNAESTFAATLESLSKQTVEDARFILIDDGSTDRSAEFAQKFCSIDPRFVLLTNPKRGRSRALNLGIAKAGEFVAILDADDVAHPFWLRDALAILRGSPSLSVLGVGRIFLRDHEEPAWPTTESSEDLAVTDVSRRFARGNLIGHTGAIIRKEALREVGGYDEARPYLVDYDLWIRLVEAGHRIGRSRIARIGKRYHPDQKFGHRPGMRRASLRMQFLAAMAIDRSAASFLALGLSGVRQMLRHAQSVLQTRGVGRQ